jgi:hypothetical protein
LIFTYNLNLPVPLVQQEEFISPGVMKKLK